MAKKGDCGCGCIPSGKKAKRKIKTERARISRKKK